VDSLDTNTTLDKDFSIYTDSELDLAEFNIIIKIRERAYSERLSDLYLLELEGVSNRRIVLIPSYK